MGLDLTGIGSVADLAKGIMDRFIPPTATEAERAAVQVQMEEMIARRDTALLETQKAVMVSEMQQADTYTKRARPTIVYAGLAFIGLVHVAVPLMDRLTSAIAGAPLALPSLSLPTEFWYTWSGVCGVWILGRSAEKRGIASKAVSLVTGGK